jgi:predicted HTH domain antitoxin
MAKLTMELPEDLLEALKLPPAEIPARLKRELAIRLYEKGLLSFGKARELAGMTKWEFQSRLGEEDILRTYDVEELEKDLKTLEELG